MPSPLAALLAEVKGLAEKATPGDWRAVGLGSSWVIRSTHGVCPTAHHNGCVIAAMADHHEPQRVKADCDLIAALKNLLPRLLALAEREALDGGSSDGRGGISTDEAERRVSRREARPPDAQDHAEIEIGRAHVLSCDCEVLTRGRAVDDTRCVALRYAIAAALAQRGAGA